MVAAWAVLMTRRRLTDQELFGQAVLTLERAYSVLTNDGREVSPVPVNRYRWLTAARHIERFKLIRTQIKSELYILLCDEHQEYWRYRFRECLRPEEIESAEYFHYIDTGHHAGPNAVEERSALVLLSFAEWPIGMEDPLDMIDIKALLESSPIAFHSRGLQEHLDHAGLLK